MAVDVVNELWQELKRYINSMDRGEAAETLVNVLIDNDVSVEEIKDTFKGDGDIKRALQSYLDDHAEDDDDYDEEYEEDEDEEDY